MKKKILIVSTLIVAGLVIGACGNQNAKTPAASSQEESSVKDSSLESSSGTTEKESIIKGKLKDDVTVDGENVSFFLVDVESVEDPTEIAKGIGEEGVFLNAEIKQVDGEFKAEDFKAGDSIEVTLPENPMMARSMPPQIPGASIVLIKKLGN
ncbi:hypothetical protein [Vagococcus salmoninarum]|uniref:hypothetical protein n=1 Tax=Vagococcus salmoninarum TaxID=2739 RepID=UPI003F97BC9E